MHSPIRIGLYSLGCSKNLVDSEVVLGDLLSSGEFALSSPKEAEVILINTCGFLEAAKQEAIETIQAAKQWKEKGNCRVLIVMGCLVQRWEEKIKDWVSGVDYLLPLNRYQELPKILQNEVRRLRKKKITFKMRHKQQVFPEVARFRLTPRHYAYLRLSEGCNHKCTFCVIPKIRGRHRSKPLEFLVEEAKELVRDGAKELNLIADDTCYYGIDLYGKPALGELLEKLNRIEGLEWIRLFYAYPTTVSDELLKTMASLEKVVPYLDMPIQHIDDGILQAMGRGKSKPIRKAIDRFRHYFPEGVLRTTVIVGFPGEGEKEFGRLFRFVEEQRFDHLGIFLYSPEPGAPSANYPNQVAEEVKKERYDRLFELQRRIVEEKNKGRVGKVEVVLLDDLRDGWLLARSWRDGPEVDQVVWVEGEGEVGQWAEVEVIDPAPFDLRGRLLRLCQEASWRERKWSSSSLSS